MRLNFSDKERKLLSFMQADSRQSIAKLATLSKMRHHSVVHARNQLIAKDKIEPYVLINPHALGLTDYCVFFYLSANKKGSRKKIIAFCQSNSLVAYFAELTGEYQYTVSLFASSIFQVDKFFQDLAQLTGSEYFSMNLAIRVRWAQFMAKGPKARILDRTKIDKIRKLDSLDYDLLNLYCSQVTLSLGKIAKILKVSESTVRNRLSRLEADKVILGVPYFLKRANAGITTFRVLISTKQLDSQFSQKLYEYSLLHPHCIDYVYCLGSWQYELNFEITQNFQAGDILEQLQDEFSSNILCIKGITEVAVHRINFCINRPSTESELSL